MVSDRETATGAGPPAARRSRFGCEEPENHRWFGAPIGFACVPSTRHRLLSVVAPAALLLAGSAEATPLPGRVGPALSTTTNGRVLHPAGRLTTVGNFPVGAALTPDGRFLWVVDGGHGHDDVQVVAVATGAVTAVLPLPGAGVGVGFAADGRTA